MADMTRSREALDELYRQAVRFLYRSVCDVLANKGMALTHGQWMTLSHAAHCLGEIAPPVDPYIDNH